MNNESVLPCPWCAEHGAEVSPSDVVGPRGPKFAVYCNACFCEGPPRYSADEAITAWNTRATAAPVVVGEDMVSRALNAQPFIGTNRAKRVWQCFDLYEADAKLAMRAALTAALAGD